MKLNFRAVTLAAPPTTNAEKCARSSEVPRDSGLIGRLTDLVIDILRLSNSNPSFRHN